MSNEQTNPPNDTNNSGTGSTTLEEWDHYEDMHQEVLRGIYAYGFEKPSPIQKKGIIPMLRKNKNGKRRDIIAQAQSGTGKTGCFAVGVLNIIDPSLSHTQALILAPTHELANQILSVVKSIGSFRKGLVTQLLVGGTSVDGDRQKLDSNPPHIVVGTPGRVHDMIRR